VIHQTETFLFIDTAGIRKRSKVKGDVEYYSVQRALQSLKRCDVALLLLDAVEGITDQDTKIATAIQTEGKGCLLVLNKIDLISDFGKFKKEKADWIQKHFPFLTFAPVLFISGKKKVGIQSLFQNIQGVMQEYEKRVGTADLNRVFEKLVSEYPHPLYKGREVKFYFMTQVGIKPPSFVVFIKRKVGVKVSYVRYLENGIRKAFSFKGVPLRIFLRERT
jgi:GTP-binding protein